VRCFSSCLRCESCCCTCSLSICAIAAAAFSCCSSAAVSRLQLLSSSQSSSDSFRSVQALLTSTTSAAAHCGAKALAVALQAAALPALAASHHLLLRSEHVRVAVCCYLYCSCTVAARFVVQAARTATDRAAQLLVCKALAVQLQASALLTGADHCLAGYVYGASVNLVYKRLVRLLRLLTFIVLVQLLLHRLLLLKVVLLVCLKLVLLLLLCRHVLQQQVGILVFSHYSCRLHVRHTVHLKTI
jgi:hypothetical protein